MGDRWAALFADLEAELDAAEAAELAEEVRDRERRELARVHLSDRLFPGTPVAVTTRGAGTIRGTVADAAREWLLLEGPDVLVAAHAVLHVTGLGATAEPPTKVRLNLGYALRALSRNGSVAMTLTDGTTFHARIDRVGADFVDLAEDGRPWRTVPFDAIATVRP
jgi:hypothetical protein